MKKSKKKLSCVPDSVQILFKGEPKFLLALENFSQVAERLKEIQVKINKEIEAVAEEHRVSLSVDIVFDLKSKNPELGV